MDPAPRARRWSTFLAAMLPVLLVGCDDERGDPTGPSRGPLDGEVMFGTALVSAEVLRTFNALAEQTLAILEGGGSLPLQLPACQGSGSATITDNNDTDPSTFSVRFTSYVIDCFAFTLTLNTDDALDARMILRFVETSPGLTFLLELPMVGAVPHGVSVQLPSEAGGIILALTTPAGPLTYTLEGSRAGLRHEGGVHIEGTLRYEDRTGPLLIVKVLDLEYEFDDALVPKFADWPSGSYEVAGFGGGGGFGFGGATAGAPVDVFFDGLGGVAFPAGNHGCVANLATGDNPCEDLN